MKIRVFCLFVSIFFLLLSVGSATAASVLDFGIIAPTGGTISYAGAGAPHVGVDIEVDNVVGLATPSNPNVARDLVDAKLSFTTGASSGVWTWGGGQGSSIQLVGGVDLNDDGDAADPGDIPIGSTLMSGEFGFASAAYFGGLFHITGSSFIDSKHNDLLEFYGLPSVLYSGNFNISFNAPFTGQGEAFSSDMVLSGDITNTPVPIPGAVWLLGSGMLGLVGVRRRFKKS